MEIKGSPMLKQPRPIETPVNLWNKNNYYHEDYGHTTSECRELKKALHEMADRGHLSHFLMQRKEPTRTDVKLS